jgi:protein TonB
VPTHIEPAAYTDEAQKAGFHGTVAVIVSVDAQGVPEKMQPTEPIPYGLDRTVSQAIRQWRFRPASEHGVPIASQTVVYVPFR